MMVDERGHTLFELMVSLALSVVLSVAMVVTYTNSRRHHSFEQELARLQENGRHALRLVSRELSMAGFYGGLVTRPGITPKTIRSDCMRDAWALDTRHQLDYISDYRAGLAPATAIGNELNCLNIADIMPGTDLVAIKRTAASASQRDGVPSPGLARSSTASWYLRIESGLAQHWEQLRAKDIAAGRYVGDELSYWKASAKIFYVHKGADGVPQLCAETLAGNAMISRCMVEGVENLQLEFGIDSDGDGNANRFIGEPAEKELGQVVAMRIHLLVRSINSVSGYRARALHDLGVAKFGPFNDEFLRRVFSQSVALGWGVRPLG